VGAPAHDRDRRCHLDEIQPETIRERMGAEAAASPAAYVSDFAFTAWGTVA
jgi:hypothetical protein